MLKRLALGSLVAASVVLAFPATSLPAATTFTTSETFEIGREAEVPCALGGAGEVVVLSGRVHVVIHTTIDDAGGTHFLLKANSLNMRGVGLTSGDKYVSPTSAHTSSHNFDPFVGPPYELTSTGTAMFVGQGPDNNLRFRDLLHVTVDANGVVRSFHVDFDADCQ